MTAWVVTSSEPAGWAEVCREANCLFHGPEWLGLLERSFGCRTAYAFNESVGQGAGISVFKAGPFGVGYLGFPVGGLVDGAGPTSELLDALRRTTVDKKPVAVRIPVSEFAGHESLDLKFDTTPETAIVDLQTWSLQTITKNRRRDVRKSLRSPLELEDATDPGVGERLYSMYEHTLQRNRGSLRYTPTYFEELIRLATNCANLRVLVARLEGQVAGFTVVAKHGDTGYYLHSAYDWEMREHIPSAALLNEAIEWARGEGCTWFNLMSSPPGQETLVKYKENWGAETREHRTYTLPTSPLFPLFRIAEGLYRLVR